MLAVLLVACLVNNDLYESRRAELTDGDGDGVTPYDGDCADGDATVYPGAPETCDGVDNDCDGLVDEDPTDAPTWYDDADGDGFGGAPLATAACDAPEGSAATGDDCDDLDPDVHPGATEHCDGFDEDCDDSVDEDAVDPATWFVDADRDGFGVDDDTVSACDAPAGTAAQGGDCDDLDDSVNPGADEVCNDGIDNNCDGGSNDCELRGELSTDDADAFILGAEGGDGVGLSVVTADLDGDGQGDVMLGALHGNAAYVVSGRSLATVTYLAATEGSLTRGAGLSDSYQLAQGNAACDVDGDGWTDALITGLEYGARSDLWIFDGPITDDRNTDGAWGRLVAESGTDFLGNSVACGDFDGDTTIDLLITAGLHDGAAGAETGAVYTVPGPLTEPGATFILDVATRVEGNVAGMHLGAYVAATDVDGDGISDRVLGSTEDPSGGEGAGAAYVMLGGNDATALADADTAIIGQEAGGRAGVVSAGDLDGDGLGDVVVGGDFVDLGGEDAGALWVFASSPSMKSTRTTSDGYDQRFFGSEAGDRLGIGNAVLNDIDHDGTSELLVDAAFADALAADGGAAMVFDQLPLDGSTLPLSDAQLTVHGTDAGALAGYSAAGGWDIDGDGWKDLVLSGFGDDTSGTDSGAAFVFLGRGW